MENLLTVELEGPLRATAANGKDVTPRGPRNQALLLLLISHPQMRRSRRWLQETLWSTRSFEQASGSLRQALIVLKRSLSPAVDVLGADRQFIYLDPKRTHLIAPTCQPHTLVEGLHVEDPAFVEWLGRFRQMSCATPTATLGTFAHSEEPSPTNLPGTHPQLANKRNQHLVQTQHQQLPSLYLVPTSNHSPVAQAIVQLINQQIVSNLNESLQVSVRFGSASETICASQSRAIAIETNAHIEQVTCILSTHLRDLTGREKTVKKIVRLPASLTHLLSETRAFRLSHEMSGHAADMLNAPVNSAQYEQNLTSLHHRAMQEMFSCEASRLRVADKLFEHLFQSRPNAVIPAWRAFLRLAIFIEQTEPDNNMLVDEIADLVDLALKIDDANPTVLALTGQITLYFNGNAPEASKFTKKALALNHGNPIAHTSHATVLLRENKHADALEHAARGMDITATAIGRHWWYMGYSLALLASNNIPKAIKYAEFAAKHTPSFRPPLRHLYALYIKTGQLDAAVTTLSKLRRFEPDFSLDFVRNNPSYPAGILRASGLCELLDVETG